MNIKNWIINKLGGITKEQQAKINSNHEKWAVKYLTGKNGEVTPDCLLYIPFDGDDIIVLRSNIIICQGRITGLVTAPWCKGVTRESLIITKKKSK